MTHFKDKIMDSVRYARIPGDTNESACRFLLFRSEIKWYREKNELTVHMGTFKAVINDTLVD